MFFYPNINIDKRGSLNKLPEYKVRILAKTLGIKPYSPTAVSLPDLKKQILQDKRLEDCLYALATGKSEDWYNRN